MIGPRRDLGVLLIVPVLAACAAQPGAAPGGTPVEPPSTGLATSVWDGVYAAEQASRGASAYRASCSSCHGPALRGDSNAPGLVGSSFLFLWEGRSLEELFTEIRTRMPTNAPNSLPAETYVDIVGFLLEANGFPAGPRELVADPAVLSRIRISGTSTAREESLDS